MQITDAIKALESKAGVVPATQKDAFEMALTMLRRAAGVARPASYASDQAWAQAQTASNAEFQNPARDLALSIIGRLLN
jgi:hypothetical protein